MLRVVTRRRDEKRAAREAEEARRNAFLRDMSEAMGPYRAAAIAAEREEASRPRQLTTPCTYLGGHGYPFTVRGVYTLAFAADDLRVMDAAGEAAVLPYADLVSVDVGGPGKTTTGGGFFGGGFGLVGAAEGMAIATVLNVRLWCDM